MVDTCSFQYIYLAPYDDPKLTAFLDRIKIFITLHSLQESDKNICGYFNCSFKRKNDKSHKNLAEIINYLDLVDIWKYKHSNIERYT